MDQERKKKLYREYLHAQSEWDRFVRPDPEMLGDSQEGRRLRFLADAAYGNYAAAIFGLDDGEGEE